MTRDEKLAELRAELRSAQEQLTAFEEGGWSQLTPEQIGAASACYSGSHSYDASQIPSTSDLHQRISSLEAQIAQMESQ